MRPALLFALFASLSSLLGCAPSKPAPSAPPPSSAIQPERSKEALSATQIEALIREVERARDRELKAPLRVVIHARREAFEAAAPSPPPARPEPVRRTLAQLYHHLDASADRGDLALSPHSAPWRAVARYEAQSHALHYLAEGADAARSRDALTRALIEAIQEEEEGDPRRDGAAAPLETLDGWLAERALREGSAALVSLYVELERQTPHEVTLQAISRSPASALATPQAALLFGPSAYGTRDLEAAMDTFALREGALLATALLRSHGWSGVEVALDLPPLSTAQVVDPARWLAGYSDASWSAPARWEEELDERGFRSTLKGAQVGAAWTAIWLARARALIDPARPDTELLPHELTLRRLSPEALQVIPASWRGDTMSVFEREDHTLMAWTSQWETPTSAEALWRVLGAATTRPSAEAQAMRCATERDGLNVAVLCSDDPALTGEWLSQRAAHLATGSGVSYRTARETMLRYVPSPSERLAQSAKLITADADTGYRDPGLGLGADLSALKALSPRPTETGVVRWFTASPGIMVQLTAEPRDALSPPFGSEHYTDRLGERLIATLPEGARVSHSATSRHEHFGRVHRLRVVTSHQNVEREIALWQVERDEMTLTLSVTADLKDAERAGALGAQVFASLGPLDRFDALKESAPTQASPPQDEP